jgi:Holliday junction resolvase
MVENKDDYIKQLEDVVRKMLSPLKGIPLNIVIKALSGYKILEFNKNDPYDRELLECLIIAFKNTMQSINNNGIDKARPNEVGNAIEYYVKKELNNLGCNATTPTAKSGRQKSTGYPDIMFNYKGKDNYLECKTFNENDLTSSLRTFYLSPSDDFKITKDAHHFLVSFEMEKRKDNKFYVKRFKILTLEKINVDVKNEFNANNKELYKSSNILYEFPEFTD